MNATGIKTPAERIAEQVLRYYASRPEMIMSLLTKLGAQHVTQRSNQIRSTCPIHNGRNARNFAVWFDRGIPYWRCMSDCADRGALTKLIMRKYKCPYEQAVGFLASLAGLQITGEMLQVSWGTLEEESEKALERKLGIDAASMEMPNVFNESWVQFAQAKLYENVGQPALNYLRIKRRFTDEMIRKWELGFVPGHTWQWTDFKDNVQRGWFEDRVAFPWRAMDGRCIGFAGRRLDDIEDMKYKTLPGTKRALAIYGLHHPETFEAIRRTGVLAIVEGYTDVIVAHMHQCYNIGCLGGTEITSRQLDIIKALNVQKLVTYMDGDGPGYVAANNIAKQAMRVVPVFQATPPRNKDPGDLLEHNEFWTPLVQCKPFIPRSIV